MTCLVHPKQGAPGLDGIVLLKYLRPVHEREGTTDY